MTENKNAIDYYQREQQNKRIKLYCIEEIPRIVQEKIFVVSKFHLASSTQQENPAISLLK